MPNSNCLNLFAYGSLMDRDELAFDLVLPSSEVDRRFRLRVAEAPGFRRIYNAEVEAWGGAVLNIEFDKEAMDRSVVGVLILDMTNQELGMLDASFPTHLPRKPLEVLVEGEKVPALAYTAKQASADAKVSARYEARMLELVERLGDPVRANFRENTFRADGTRCYADGLPAPGAPETAPDEGSKPEAPPGGGA